MHEMTVAIDVVDKVEECLRDLGPGARATSVTLQVGGLRAIVPEALAFCFEAAAAGTRVEGARLIVEQIPVRVSCAKCGTDWVVHEIEFVCPTCEGPVRVIEGKELTLRSIEVDDGTGADAPDDGAGADAEYGGPSPGGPTAEGRRDGERDGREVRP